MRLHCKEHGFIDERIELLQQCPFCEIERLTAERDRYKEALERIGKFGWDAYISNIVRNVLEKTPTR